MILQNKSLLNPSNGKPYTYQDPKLDDRGQVVEEQLTLTDGRQITRAVMLSAKDYDLFELILRTMRYTDKARPDPDGVKKFFKVSTRIYAARGKNAEVEAQSVKLGPKLLEWLKNEMRIRLLHLYDNREFLAVAWEALELDMGVDEGPTGAEEEMELVVRPTLKMTE